MAVSCEDVEEQRSVYLHESGQLSAAMADMNMNWQSIEELTIYGAGLNSSDFYYMCGSMPNLKLLDISKTATLTIPKGAFSHKNLVGHMSLVAINLPSSLEEISLGAFEWCYLLRSITIPNGVKYILQDTFYNCHDLTEITLPSTLNEIYPTAFEGCTSLSTVTVHSEHAHIGGNIFPVSPLEHIYIPANYVDDYKSSCWSEYADIIQPIQ